MVTAATTCETGETGYHLVRQATAAADGTFSIPAFGEECQRYRLTADKRSDFWLETGDAVFYGSSNGTAPTLDFSAVSASAPVTIVLGQRGGRIDFRVWDTATAHFIYAELGIERKLVEGKKFGSMWIATGKDGSVDTLLLPQGEYVASVLQYQCGDKEYWAAAPPQFPFEVTAGIVQEPKIVIDVHSIKSSRTYSNPRGKKCKI